MGLEEIGELGGEGVGAGVHFLWPLDFLAVLPVETDLLGLLEQAFEGLPGDDKPFAETEHGQLASVHHLVGEGATDAQEFPRFLYTKGEFLWFHNITSNRLDESSFT